MWQECAYHRPLNFTSPALLAFSAHFPFVPSSPIPSKKAGPQKKRRTRGSCWDSNPEFILILPTIGRISAQGGRAVQFTIAPRRDQTRVIISFLDFVYVPAVTLFFCASHQAQAYTRAFKHLPHAPPKLKLCRFLCYLVRLYLCAHHCVVEYATMIEPVARAHRAMQTT